jgi:hypothetical protein
LLNSFTWNGKWFDSNSIPRGILQLVGNYDNSDLAAFKRLWNAMCRGIQNVHNLPIITAKDTDSKALFTEVGGQLTEMAFGKWISLLTSIACAIFGISPEEISMESYTSGKAPLSGSDTEEKITSSNDKGLSPLLSHFENEYTDYIIRCFSPQYRMSFVGLNADDAAKRFEMRKLTQVWNEARRDQGYEEIKGPLGECPLNPALQGPWMQILQSQMQQEQQDFGQPADGNQGEPLPDGNPNPDGALGGAQQDREGDFGEEPQGDESAAPATDFGKALDASRFGLPIFALD